MSNFPPVGADQRSHINAVGSRSSAWTGILDWRLVRNKRIFNLVAHLPQSSERRAISNDDLLSPNFYRRQKKKERKKTQAQSQARSFAESIQMWNVNKSNRLIWLVVLILFANLPRRGQREVLRKSPQLFTFFLPVSPREAAPAANGAQQRLDSLVRIRDPRAARPLTHLRTVIANTAVLSFTLRRCGASSAARRTLQSKEIAALRPVVGRRRDLHR